MTRDPNLPTTPVDIQQALDDLLLDHPEFQQYVTKLWYLAEGAATPAGVTHVVRLASQLSPERALTIGAEVVPAYAVILDSLLALIATQPPGAS